MKIFSADQIKRADQFTIDHEPIAPIDLMERAGQRLANHLLEISPSVNYYVVFAGPGNNGGDGLVIARILHQKKKNVKVYLLEAEQYSIELSINIERLKKEGIEPTIISNQKEIDLLSVPLDAMVIDALFGTGLNRPLNGLVLELVKQLNTLLHFVVSIDVPSGMSADAKHISTVENTIVANLTLTIQLPKLAFFFAENYQFTGEWKIVNIDLDKGFIENESTPFFCLDHVMVKDMIKPRAAFSHKGTFGHALLIAGSKGKIGAAVLSGHAALKTGCGLLTMQIPAEGVEVMHISLPETMVIADSNNDFVTDVIDISAYNAIGFGPGIDQHESTAKVLKMIIQNASQPLVIDADGLNILSNNLTWLQFLNGHTIFTPHPGEFDRLTKKHLSGLDRFNTQLEFSKKYGVYIVLKGHHTSITTPGGLAFFNSTGNDGMATGGSGDVLTGIITSLCAQGYSPLHACLLGVYLHGYAGDRAAEDESKTSLIASDIIEHIPTFFLEFEK